MASKIFGGANLSDIARSVKERAEPSPFDKTASVRPILPAADLESRGARCPRLERENICPSIPSASAPGATTTGATAGNARALQDLIDSISRDEQQVPAVARSSPAIRASTTS